MIRALFLLSTSIALAQQIPLLGYLASGATVRPIAGAPGAVVVGDAIPIPDDVTAIFPVPRQRIAIVERAGAEVSSVLALGVMESGALKPIANSFAHSDRVAFSPSGSVAVLYSADRGQAQILAGFPHPEIARTVDVSGMGLPLTSIAVSDDAQTLLAGVSDGNNGAIWRFAAGQDPQQIAAAGVPSSIRFFDGKRDAVIADAGWHQVSVLSNGAAPQMIAGSAQGVNSPADVEISADQQTVWVCDSANGLFRIDLSSSSVAAVDGAIPAARVLRLMGGSNFLLVSGDGANAALWAPDSANQRMWRILGN